jgi:hypothetical protein
MIKEQLKYDKKLLLLLGLFLVIGFGAFTFNPPIAAVGIMLTFLLLAST